LRQREHLSGAAERVGFSQDCKEVRGALRCRTVTAYRTKEVGCCQVYFLGALLFVLVFGFVGPSLALSEALRPPQGGLLERSGGQGRRGTRRHG